MMIKNLNPECVWRNFDALTKVPRPSGHLEKVQQFLLDFAAKVGVEAFKDPADNIVMRKPATAITSPPKANCHPLNRTGLAILEYLLINTEDKA